MTRPNSHDGCVHSRLCGPDSSGEATALIPAGLGAVLLLLAAWGRREGVRKHAMHGAMLIALVGIAGTVRGLMQLPTLLAGGEVARPAAVYAQSLTALALVVLLVSGIRSFVAARRNT